MLGFLLFCVGKDLVGLLECLGLGRNILDDVRVGYLAPEPLHLVDLNLGEFLAWQLINELLVVFPCAGRGVGCPVRTVGCGGCGHARVPGRVVILYPTLAHALAGAGLRLWIPLRCDRYVVHVNGLGSQSLYGGRVHSWWPGSGDS